MAYHYYIYYRVMPGQIAHVAEQAARKLADLGIANDGECLSTYRYTVTDIPLRFQTIGERFLGRSLGRVDKVDW